jgi:hypothetical protein
MLFVATDENADDIRELLEAVPELDRVFNVMNKVGSGL